MLFASYIQKNVNDQVLLSETMKAWNEINIEIWDLYFACV